MNGKKGMNQKENDCPNLLLFLNDIKHVYRMNQYWSNTLILDSFFNILNHVVTITRKLSVPLLKSTLTERQIGQSKSSLQKEINFFFKSLQSHYSNPQGKNREAKSSLNSITNKPRTFEAPKTMREISNQNIIAKIKEKIKTQTLNNSASEISHINNERHIPGIRAISQRMRNNQRESWKAPGNITSRNNSSMNWSKPKGRENYQREREYSKEQRERSKGGKKSRGDSKDNNGSSDIKLSFYATRLVNQYHNVIHKYYTIKTEEEIKKSRTASEGKNE